MSHIEQTVYAGTDNAIELQLTEDGVPVPDHTVITGAVLELRGVMNDITSVANPSYFDFTNADRIILKLGTAGIPVGTHWMQLKIITAAAPNGIVWQPDVKIKVV